MAFTEDQKAALNSTLSRARVKKNPRGYDYVEGWFAIAEANRIFGFDAWSRETVEIRCVNERAREIGTNKAPGHGVTYIARVRVTVGQIIREGCGSGHGIDKDLGLAHESAIKEAETDAMKRALMTFGNPFGLALYDKEQTNVAEAVDESRERFLEACKATIADQTKTPPQIEAWWKSDEHRKGLRLHGLSQQEVDGLKALLVARIKPQQRNAA